MRLRRCLEGLLFLVLMFGDSLASAGTVYNAAGDFSIASNPNGVWSYGTTGTTLTGPLALFTTTKSGIGLIPNWKAGKARNRCSAIISPLWARISAPRSGPLTT